MRACMHASGQVHDMRAYVHAYWQAQSDEGMTEPEIDAKRQRIDAYFEAGTTALMHAAALGHTEVVKLLVDAGA